MWAATSLLATTMSESRDWDTWDFGVQDWCLWWCCCMSWQLYKMMIREMRTEQKKICQQGPSKDCYLTPRNASLATEDSKITRWI